MPHRSARRQQRRNTVPEHLNRQPSHVGSRGPTHDMRFNEARRHVLSWRPQEDKRRMRTAGTDPRARLSGRPAGNRPTR
jgi:hypothetical protein